MVRSGLVWNNMVHGYCLDELPCKVSSFLFKKQLSYGQYREIWFGLEWLGLIWFGLEWLGLVWFDFEWYGIWVMSRCSYMHNFELDA